MLTVEQPIISAVTVLATTVWEWALLVAGLALGAYFLFWLALAPIGLAVIGGPAWLVWKILAVRRMHKTAKAQHLFDDAGYRCYRDLGGVHYGDSYTRSGPVLVFPVSRTGGWFSNESEWCVRADGNGGAVFCDRRGRRPKRVPRKLRHRDPQTELTRIEHERERMTSYFNEDGDSSGP